MNKILSQALKKAVSEYSPEVKEVSKGNRPDLFSLSTETELFQNDIDIIIKIDKFYKDPEFQLKLSDKSSELSKNLSGENKFTKNWEKIEEMLYE